MIFVLFPNFLSANNATGSAYVFGLNSTTGLWAKQQRLTCASSSGTHSAPCQTGKVTSQAAFGYKVGIYENSSTTSFLIVGAPGYCKHFPPDNNNSL